MQGNVRTLKYSSGGRQHFQTIRRKEEEFNQVTKLLSGATEHPTQTVSDVPKNEVAVGH